MASCFENYLGLTNTGGGIKSAGGLPGLIEILCFEIEDKKIVNGGSFGIFLLKNAARQQVKQSKLNNKKTKLGFEDRQLFHYIRNVTTLNKKAFYLRNRLSRQKHVKCSEFNMKDQYKNIAAWYDKIFEPMNSGLREIGIKMYPAKAGMNVLDIGCGTGAHLKLYQKEKCSVFGIDLSAAMLKIAGKKLGSNADLKLCDASNTPFANDKFDLILSSTVLHEMSPRVRVDVLNEAKRVLKKDGRILLIDFHTGPIKKFKGTFSKIRITIAEIAAGREHYKNYRHFIKNGGLPVLIESHGFEVEDKKIVSGGTFGVFLLKNGVNI